MSLRHDHNGDMHHQTHALVWLDHRLAKVFRFDAESSTSSQVQSTHPHENLHHKANSGDSGHAPIDKKFLDAVAHALPMSGPILIAGPGSAKKELQAHLMRFHPPIAARVSEVKPLDHPTDGELLAFGRRFFDADVRMRAQPH
jgi:stalled ribosome rescue protein Dom34